MKRAALIIALALAGTGCVLPAARGGMTPTGPIHAPALAPCEGDIITVADGQPTGCDMIPPQQLNITGTTPATCADMGGSFAEPDTCERVDY
jgi:hypothetical protein